jgi:hypothetical protein
MHKGLRAKGRGLEKQSNPPFLIFSPKPFTPAPYSTKDFLLPEKQNERPA